MLCMCVCACVQSDLKHKENTNILEKVHETAENGTTYSFSYKKESTKKNWWLSQQGEFKA